MCVLEIASVVSDGLSLYTQIQSIRNERAVGKYNVEQSIKQAQLAEKKAAYERQEGIEDARERRLKAIQAAGSRMTSIAAGNISMASSTALNAVDDEKLGGEVDALRILESSERQAESYMDTAQNYYAQASLQSFKSKNTYKDKLISLYSNNLHQNTSSTAAMLSYLS